MSNFIASYDPAQHYVTYTDINDKSRTIKITDLDGGLTPKAVVITGLFDQKKSREAIAIVKKATNYDPKKDGNNERFFGPNSVIAETMPQATGMNSNKVNEVKVSIDKPTCGRLKPGTYKIGDILTCGYGDSKKESTESSTEPKQHTRHLHTRHASASKEQPPAPVTDTTPGAGTTTEQPANAAAPAQPPASAPPAPPAAPPAPAAKTETKPPAQAADTAAKPPVQQTPPAQQTPPPAPRGQQPLYSYTPGASGFDLSSILFGMVGGMGLMALFGGFGGGGFLSFGGYGFHHPHQFAFHHGGFEHFGGFHHGGFGGFHHGGLGSFAGGFHHGFGRHC